MVFMQILTILRNGKFTYKRNSRKYTCVYKEKIYYSFYCEDTLEAVYETAAVKLSETALC